MIRRIAALAMTVALVVGAGGLGYAQPGSSEGDRGPAPVSFQNTDGNCNFPNFVDVYTATLSRNERGEPVVDLVQESTGDRNRVEKNEDGEIVVTSENGTEIWDDVEILPARFRALYTYVADGCAQQWDATIELPPGFLAYVVNESLAAEEAATPSTTLLPAPKEEIVEEIVEEVVEEVEEETGEEISEEAEEAIVEEIVEEIAEESVEETQTVETTSDNGSGSALWLLILIFIAALFLIWFGLFWFYWKPKRLYRFDRGDGGTYLDDDEVEMTVMGGELILEDPPQSEEVFEIPLASTIFIDKPPAHRLCDTTHAEWVKSVERLAQLEADADDRVGTDDAQPERHALMLRQARASMERWRELYEECLEAHPDEPVVPAPTSGPDTDTDDPEPDPNSEDSGGDDDGESGADEPDPESGSPGTSPPVPPPVVSMPDCVEGSTEARIEDEADFRVLDGNVKALTTNSVLFGASGVSGGDLEDMSDSDIEALFENIETLGPENKVTVQVHTRLLTVKCIRIWVCNGGRWIRTEQTNRVEQYSDPQTHTFRQKSQDAVRSRRMVNKNVRPLLQTLLAEEESAADFECDF